MVTVHLTPPVELDLERPDGPRRSGSEIPLLVNVPPEIIDHDRGLHADLQMAVELAAVGTTQLFADGAARPRGTRRVRSAGPGHPDSPRSRGIAEPGYAGICSRVSRWRPT